MSCTASPRAIVEAREAGKIPQEETSSSYATEGTEAHAFAAKALLDGVVPAIPDADTAYAVETYFMQVRELQLPGDILFVEYAVPLFYEPEHKGTLDCGLVRNNRIVIADYKHGTGVTVDAVGNPQLALYGRSLYEKLKADGLRFDDNCEVLILIVQPNAIGGKALKTWYLTLAELIEFTDRIAKVRSDILSGGGVFVASPDNCQFCPLATSCAARASLTIMPLDLITDDAVSSHLRLPGTGTLSKEDVALVLRSADSIRSWLNAVEARAHDLLNRGEEVPGFKLVRGKGRRRWADGAADTLEMLLGEAAYSHELMSPAQIETLLKRRKMKFPLDQLTVVPDAAPRIVPTSHKGESTNAVDDMPIE